VKFFQLPLSTNGNYGQLSPVVFLNSLEVGREREHRGTDERLYLLSIASPNWQSKRILITTESYYVIT